MGAMVHFGEVAHAEDLVEVENVILDLLKVGRRGEVGLEHAVVRLDVD